jgi:hypothetical protein
VKAVVDRRMTYVAVGFMVDRMFGSNVAAPGSSTATMHAVRRRICSSFIRGQEVLNLGGRPRRRTREETGLEAINICYTSKRAR